MAILITTSNFPDVMLPALNVNYLFFIYFFIYLVFGLYFLLNVLLATIFSGYKSKLAERAIETANNRLIYLEKYYNLCDIAKKGYLNLNEARKFFRLVLNFNYKKEDDVRQFKILMKILDPQRKNEVEKITIMDFFALPGFSSQISSQDIAVIKVEQDAN